MQFVIQVVEANEVKGKKNARGSLFNAVALVYRRDGQVKALSFPDWSNKEIYQTLLELKAGETRTVTAEKVNEFWKWLSISAAGEQAATEASKNTSEQVSSGTAGGQAGWGGSATASGNTGRTGKVVGSNYETSEERARRQVMIVRQSSISSAVAMLPEVRLASDIIAAAEVFEAYVLGE